LGLTTLKGKSLTAQTFESLLRNPIYCGWVVIPSWNLRERGSFEPLVEAELFQRVQDILDNKRTAIVPHIRNDEDFPLRVFVRCADCGVPLTGSWNKGRGKHYPNYRCCNAQCRAVNIRKEALEQQFLQLLHRLKPRADIVLLFRGIILETWNRKQADARAQASAIRQRLEKLTGRKNALMDRYLDSKIPQQTYNEQNERLSGEIDEAKSALVEVAASEGQIDELLDFADRVLKDPAGLWRRASLDMRQRLQKVLFPAGLAYSAQDGFGTVQTPSFFNMLAAFETENSSLASPTGFEPVLPP
jgi:site-specific DNA recombinase